MKALLLITSLLITLLFAATLFSNASAQASEHDDFSEFDDPDDLEVKNFNQQSNEQMSTESSDQQTKPTSSSSKDHSSKIQTDDDFQDLSSDEDEEVTVEEEVDLKDDLPTEGQKEKKPFEPIKLSSLPLHLRNNWTSYYIELSLICCILLYFVNFFIGSSTNQKLADTFLNANIELLQSHFSLVGDDGSKELEKRQFVKLSDNTFVLWCTGRFGYECCIIELQMNRRQDLLSSIWGLIRPTTDRVTIKIFLSDNSIDSFVFCLANKKTGLKVVKEYQDVVTFCTQRKSIEKYTFLNDHFILLNEISDVASLVLDGQVVDLLAKSPELVNFIHLSDQFTGLKQSESDVQLTKAPPTKKVLTLSFNYPRNSNSSTHNMDQIHEFVAMSLNLAERVKRYKLKKDMKQKALQNRKKIEDFYEKRLIAEMREAAQLKKEEKRRQEKEKIIDANDEFRLRKFEEKEYKKEMKKKMKPKIKQVRAS